MVFLSMNELLEQNPVANNPFRPMLAVEHDPDMLRFPYLASPKVDGIRAFGWNSQAMSRSMKPIPNKFVQHHFEDWGRHANHLDGELVVDSPMGLDTFDRTSGALRRVEGTPNFTFYVFDTIDLTGKVSAYERWDRAKAAVKYIASPRMQLMPQQEVANTGEMLEFEETALAVGYEGIMLRGYHSPYKQNRSTVRENYLLKVKRWVDVEATITGWYERMHNANEATVNELGRTSRSKHQENLHGRGDLGGWECEYQGMKFNCGMGPGFTDASRATYWARRDEFIGKLAKVQYFPIGMKDAPRFPKFMGLRDAFDL